MSLAGDPVTTRACYVRKTGTTGCPASAGHDRLCNGVSSATTRRVLERPHARENSRAPVFNSQRCWSLPPAAGNHFSASQVVVDFGVQFFAIYFFSSGWAAGFRWHSHSQDAWLRSLAAKDLAIRGSARPNWRVPTMTKGRSRAGQSRRDGRDTVFERPLDRLGRRYGPPAAKQRIRTYSAAVPEATHRSESQSPVCEQGQGQAAHCQH